MKDENRSTYLKRGVLFPLLYHKMSLGLSPSFRGLRGHGKSLLLPEMPAMLQTEKKSVSILTPTLKRAKGTNQTHTHTHFFSADDEGRERPQSDSRKTMCLCAFFIPKT